MKKCGVVGSVLFYGGLGVALFGCVFSVGLLFVGFGFLVFGGFLADKN